MAFDIRCPDCKARLRLDDPPEPGTPIECPRCEASFNPPSPASASSKKGGTKLKEPPKAEPQAKKGSKKAASGTPKKRKIKKKRTNPVVLLIGIGFGFLFLFCVGAAMIWVLNRPGKVMDMMSYLSADCNYARGMNLTHWNKYPGYATEVTKIYNPAIKAAGDEFARLAGGNPETFIDYLLIGKIRSGGTSTTYVLRTSKSFNVQTVGAALTGATPSGPNTFTMSATAPGVLARSSVYLPDSRTIVIVASGPKASKMLSDAQSGKASSMVTHFNDTVKITARGASWLIVRNTGNLQNYIVDTAAKGSDLPGIPDNAKTSPTLGIWCTPGGSGIRVGLALECASRTDASELVRAMKNGPLGKGDESEPTNAMKGAGVSGISDKKAFGEFMQYLTYTSSGACAYAYSTVSGDSSIRTWLTVFNNSSAALDDTAGGGGGGPMGFAPPGGGGPGMPGGIAPPGMVGP